MSYINGKTELLDVIIGLVIQEEFHKVIVLYLYLGLNDTHVFFQYILSKVCTNLKRLLKPKICFYSITINKFSCIILISQIFNCYYLQEKWLYNVDI